MQRYCWVYEGGDDYGFVELGFVFVGEVVESFECLWIVSCFADVLCDLWDVALSIEL